MLFSATRPLPDSFFLIVWFPNGCGARLVAEDASAGTHTPPLRGLTPYFFIIYCEGVLICTLFVISALVYPDVFFGAWRRTHSAIRDIRKRGGLVKYSTFPENSPYFARARLVLKRHGLSRELI